VGAGGEAGPGVAAGAGGDAGAGGAAGAEVGSPPRQLQAARQARQARARALTPDVHTAGGEDSMGTRLTQA
jgi:hypothetical protein